VKKQIAAPVRLSGLPNDFYIQGVQATSRLDVAGTTLSSVSAERMPVPRAPTSAAPQSSELSAMQGALGAVRLVGPTSTDEGELWPVVLTVTDQEFAQFGHASARLTASLDFYLARTTVAGAIPLQEGRTSADDRRRFEIVRIDRRADRCIVNVRVIAVGSAFDRRMTSRVDFVLRNAARGEAVRATVESATPNSISPLGFLLGMAWGGGGYSAAANPDAPGFSVVARRYRCPAAEFRVGQHAVIDSAWLAGAELVRIDIAYAGQVTRTLTIENFRMSQ
jgi:hypothetical protein